MLLAAGPGTRLRPLTDTVPKCLVRIGDRVLLDHWLERFRNAGLHSVRINTHHLPELVQRHLAKRAADDVFHFEERFEPVLLGSAGTLTANRDLASEADDVLIVYADNLSDMDLGAMLRLHAKHDDPITMALFRAPRPSSCGIVELDGSDRIVRFEEKPPHPASDLANAGVYLVRADTYREIADMKAFDLGRDVLPRYVGRMRGWIWDGYHLDIGTPEALDRARRDHPGRSQASG